jgi:hypothetical protein
LNAISVAESDAGEYLTAWAEVTPSEEVKAVIAKVALREREHGVAFAKRIDALGYAVRPGSDPKQAERVAIAGSTVLSDKEKFEAFDLGKRPRNGQRDIFDSFFENKDLDPVTGGLLGRYVAEERDSGRLLADCYGLLCAEAERTTDAASNGPTSTGKTKGKAALNGGKAKARAAFNGRTAKAKNKGKAKGK